MAYTGCSFAVISNTTQVLGEVLEQIYPRTRKVDTMTLFITEIHSSVPCLMF